VKNNRLTLWVLLCFFRQLVTSIKKNYHYPKRMPPKRQAPKPVLPPLSEGSRAGIRARLDDNDENAMVVTAKAPEVAAPVAAVSRDVLSELSVRVEELSGAFVRLANRGDSGSLRAAADAETAALREQIRGENGCASLRKLEGRELCE
jgi:hypothetical protein